MPLFQQLFPRFLPNIPAPPIFLRAVFNSGSRFPIWSFSSRAAIAAICILAVFIHLFAFSIALKCECILSNANNTTVRNGNFEALGKIADRDKFSPNITCHNNDGWKLVAKYHLEFDDWTEPVEPMVALFKDLIAEFEKRIANISPKAYRDMQD